MNKKKTLLLAVIIVMTVSVIIYFLLYRKNHHKNNMTDQINYNPPTQEEKKAGDRRKSEVDQQEQRRTQTQPSEVKPGKKTNKKDVTVVITDANQYEDIIEVRAFIPDYYENGTCTVTFTKGTQSLTKTTPAYKDISTTICTNPLIKRSEFTENGSWYVRVSYTSGGAEGISSEQKVMIK